jgi:hypothetical protein
MDKLNDRTMRAERAMTHGEALLDEIKKLDDQEFVELYDRLIIFLNQQLVKRFGRNYNRDSED